MIGIGAAVAQSENDDATSASTTDALLAEINGALGAQDWSAVTPFWFAPGVGAPTNGVIDMGTIVRIERDRLVVTYVDELESYLEARTPSGISPVAAGPQFVTSFTANRMDLSVIDGLSTIEEISLMRLGTEDETLEELRARAPAAAYEDAVAYEFYLLCPQRSECGEMVFVDVSYDPSGAESTPLETAAIVQIGILAPSRAEAETLHAAFSALLEHSER